MYNVLTVIAILGALIGLVFLSEATMGVGIIGIAAVAGILARLGQAEVHHKELLKEINELDGRVNSLEKTLAPRAPKGE